jgi:IclR family pca regulon transcriptional regulator
VDGDERRDLSESLVKGLGILRCFSSQSPLMRITDISDQLGLSRSSSHRYASTLVALGYLEQDDSRRYRLGLRAADLGIAAIGAIEMRRRARPHVQQLRSLSGGTVALAVLDDTETVYVERLRGARCVLAEAHTPLGAGCRLAAYATASGMVLLAALEAQERTALLGKIPKASSRSGLRTELERIAKTGLALQRGRAIAAIRSLAVAIPVQGSPSGVALELALPSGEGSAERLVADWGVQLTETAQDIGEELEPGSWPTVV